MLIRNYLLSGRLLPGLNQYVNLKLVDAHGQAEEIRSDGIQPDGRFYFVNVPDGEYLLDTTTWVNGAGGDFYYPGRNDRKKAVQIQDRKTTRSPGLANLTSIRTRCLWFRSRWRLIRRSIPAGFRWRIQLLSSNYIATEERWTPGGKFVLPYEVRGWSHGTQLYGYSNHPTEYGACTSEPTPVTAKTGLSVIHMSVPAECR